MFKKLMIITVFLAPVSMVGALEMGFERIDHSRYLKPIISSKDFDMRSYVGFGDDYDREETASPFERAVENENKAKRDIEAGKRLIGKILRARGEQVMTDQDGIMTIRSTISRNFSMNEKEQRKVLSNMEKGLAFFGLNNS